MTKKVYNQPEMQIAHISLDAMILAGSAINGGGKLNAIETDDQW